jgi:DNA-binding response OmpR family regulator
MSAHRILVVEDDPFLSDLYVSALSMAGYAVTSATDAQEALDVLDEYGADVMVLDLLLPAHNGLEVLQELQTHTDWCNLPILILSAQRPDLLQPMKIELQRLNVKGYLYKPDTKPADLLAAIAELLHATI